MSNIRTATLELTLNCNFRCSHCYIQTTSKGGDILVASDWIRVIDRLLGIGCRRYILTGGEVLLSASFHDVYRYLKKADCHVAIFTNGSVLQQSHQDLFTEHPPDSISITLYGNSAQEYRLVTGCGLGAYDLVQRNIETLRSIGIRVDLGTILCQSLKAGAVHSNRAHADSIAMNTYLIPALHRTGNLTQRLTPAEVLEIETQNQDRDAYNRQLYAGLKPMEPDSEDYLRKCSGGHSSLFVSAMGRVSICAIYREMSLNLLDEGTPMLKILKQLGDVHENFRQLYFNSKCGTCNQNRNCRNCPAYAMLETGRPGENPYLCELAKVRTDHYVNDPA